MTCGCWLVSTFVSTRLKKKFGSIEVVPAVLKCATWCTLIVVPSGAVSFTLRVKVFVSF